MCASLKKKTRYRNWIFFPFLHHNSTRFCCVFFFHFLTQVPECGMRIARLPGVSLFCDSVLSCCYFFISLLVFFSFLLVFLLPSAVIAGAPAFQAPRLPTIRQKISHTQKKKIINKETLSQDRRTSWLVFFLMIDCRGTLSNYLFILHVLAYGIRVHRIRFFFDLRPFEEKQRLNQGRTRGTFLTNGHAKCVGTNSPKKKEIEQAIPSPNGNKKIVANQLQGENERTEIEGKSRRKRKRTPTPSVMEKWAASHSGHTHNAVFRCVMVMTIR